MKHQGKAVIERCQECDSCQEWILTPTQAPRCTNLLIMLPNGDVTHAGTERKAFRIIERWFADDAQIRATVSPARFAGVGTIEWRHGTCPPPVLRRKS